MSPGFAPEARRVTERPVPGQRISAVICAYTERRWDHLARGVAALRAQTAPVHEVLVVIDGNRELQARADRELEATVIPNTREQGAAGARNTGVARTSGDLIAFVDDDALPALDWAAAMLAAHTDPTVLGVGGSLEPAWATGRPRWFPEEFDWVVGCSYIGMTPGPIRNPIAANMTVRRDVFESIGGFQEAVSRRASNVGGTEETDLAIRALREFPDGHWLYLPEARALHAVSPDREEWTYFMRRCWGEGQAKAAMVEAVGTGDGLSSERSYATRTLPAGVARHLAAGVRGRELGGFLRAGAIIAGLAITGASYVVGKIRRRRSI